MTEQKNLVILSIVEFRSFHSAEGGSIMTDSVLEVVGSEVPNMPWEEKPKDYEDLLWRFSGNPIVDRRAIPGAHSVFNSGVVPFGNRFAGVFRADHTTRKQRLHVGFSEDGINWRIEPDPIQLDGPFDFDYGYDPRVVEFNGLWYLTWCNGYGGSPVIGLAFTDDFRIFCQMENITLPHNRNGVLFPRKIENMYVLLSRPSDDGHTQFGDIWLSRSPHLRYWGDHRLVMKPEQPWENLKIGAGPVPIETSEGWLLLYHGVLNSCNGFTYATGAALLDLEEPWRVIGRTKSCILWPEEPYECVGSVPNVVFPCAAICDSETGRLALYYGAADSVMAIAFGKIDEIIDRIKEDSSG